MFLKSVLAAATVAVLTMTGCSSGSSPAAAPSTSGPSVAVVPSTAMVAVGASQAFSATVAGAAAAQVTWSILEGAAGGTITSSGLYTAPAAAGTYHVVATDAANGAVGGATVIAATPSGTVSKVYVNDATVAAGGTVQLTEVVTAAAGTNTSVTWSIDPGSLGSVDPVTGVYTAPGTPGVNTVRATSNADPTKSDYGLVTVTSGGSPAPAPSGTTPAFAGAEGGGAVAVGGRGGSVYEVTNLADSGAGSLRACTSASGPRTCVFRVAGTIYLSSSLEIVNPYLTIAGQTAPGGGVQLAGASGRPANMALMRVRANDVVVRYLRFRQNSVPGDLESGGNGSYGIGDNDQGSYNSIFDHISATYACGKQFSIWSSGNGPHNVTVQWSILGYPVGCAGGDGGANTAISGADSTVYTAYQTDIDWHHNLITTSTKRMPLFKSKSGRIVNNVIYNWGINSVQIGGGAYVDVIANVWKMGPKGPGSQREIGLYDGNATTSGCGGATPCHPWIYASGNKSDWHTLSGGASDATNWNTVVCLQSAEGDSPCTSTPPDASYSRSAPLAASTSWNGTTLSQSASGGVPITVTPSEGLLGLLVPSSGGSLVAANSVGVSRRLDCAGNWVAQGVRDGADTTALSDVLNGSGVSGSLPPPPPPPPSIAAVSATCAAGATDNASCACLDSDHDGMPDVWETAHGLNPLDPSDGPAVQPDGYTNLEHYTNGQ